jgi:hypothetical protein
MTEDAVISPSTDLRAVRVRRAGLRRACEGLRAVLADGAEPGRLRAAAAEVEELWATHIGQTEAPDGVLAQILADCPRLAPMVSRLRADHPAITRRLDGARQRLDGPDPGPERAADELLAALAAIDRHRNGGSELIYRAYTVDVGLGE